MSTGNEREIRDRLEGALGTLTPARPPVESVMRRGRGIRMRRRAGVAAGLAVIVAAAVALPGLLRQAEHQPAPAQRSYHVTVSPPPRGAPAGEIATGTIDGKPWTVTYGMDHGRIIASGPHLLNDQPHTSAAGEVANLNTQSAGNWALLTGSVQRDVTRVALTVPGGSVLNLQPVAWHGHRWLAVVVPVRMPILRVTAYSRHGELRYAIPFANSEVVAWLKPGQRGYHRASATFSSAAVNGQRRVTRAYLGPWGLCLADPGERVCTSDVTGRLSRDRVVTQLSCGFFQKAAFSINLAGVTVRTVRLSMSDGSTQVAHPVLLGPVRMFGYTTGHGLRLTGWTAFGPAGQQLGTGTGAGWACNG